MAAADIDFVSARLFSDAAYRRRLMYGMLEWMKANRGWQRFDYVLCGGLLAVCENTRTDAETSRQVKLLASQREALASSRVNTLEQRARNQIFSDLKSHPRIETDVDHWRLKFKPLHDGLNSENIGGYLARFTHGIPQAELTDAYPGVASDISALLSEGRIYSIENREKSTATVPCLVLFPRDDMGIKVDADIRQMWQKDIADAPKGIELDEALFRQGHLSQDQFSKGHIVKARQHAKEMQVASDAAKAAAADNKLKRKKPMRGVLTNTHLLGQYDFLSKLAAAKPK